MTTKSATDTLLDELVLGMRKSPKHLPTALLYDKKGSELFEKITKLSSYYLTKAEMEILSAYGHEIAAELGEEILLIEYGAGNLTKIDKILTHLKNPSAYVPVDISKEFLEFYAKKLFDSYPKLVVVPNVSDFSKGIKFDFDVKCKKRAVFIAGSTIGNFGQEGAVSVLENAGNLTGEGGVVLVGFDLIKDKNVIEKAYNDDEGVTGKFTLNILSHINGLWQANFESTNYTPYAVYNEALHRVELFLKSSKPQSVKVGSNTFSVAKDEKIITEYSYKYSPDTFSKLAKKAGLVPAKYWQDKCGFFRLQMFVS